MIRCAKAPFEWDLNQPGSPGESEPQHNIEPSATNREADKGEIVKDSARSGINWTVKKRRNQIKPSESKGWNWKSLPENTITLKLKKPRKKYIPTKEQRERYSKRKRESYASMDKAARRRLASKLHIQQKERFANMTSEEQKAFVARRNELERIRKRKLKITRTEEETLKHQTVRQIQNKRYRLNKQAKKVCMTQAADESSHKKPKFDFDLNEPAIESEKDDSPASDSSRKREPEKGLSVDNSPLKWQRNQSKQRSNRKPIQDLSRIRNMSTERIIPISKGKRYKDTIPKEQYELSKKNKREAYALKSKEERQAISFKNRQYFEKRLANMTPEQRKEYEAKEDQREQKYKPRRKLLRRKRYLLQKEKTS